MAEVAYIGLGANLNDPASTLKKAIEELKSIPDTEFLSASSLYSSAPMGPADQPDYVNAVAAVRTKLDAETLFKYTCQIELDHGRVRNGEHWGPRTLDLDILLFGQHNIDTETLTVPHYGMKQREFVIYPLLEIAQELVLPCGTPLQQLTASVAINGMTKLQ